MKRLLLLLSIVLLVGGARIVQTLAPTATIVVEAMSPQRVHDLGLETSPSTGLSVVGLGELVYLRGAEAAGEAVTSYSWSLTGPAGSTAILASATTASTTFRPDVTGKYTVNLSITTGTGVSNASKVITSAEYVSVGAVDGKLFPDVRAGECAGCHSKQTDVWSKTDHATMFKRAIDGQVSSHYGENCISCHTLGFNTDVTAVNGGFDDVAKALGWKFPATLQAGNWDSMIQNYPDLARRASIQCENCHGPGSMHRGDISGTEVSMETGVCARCHDEEPRHFITKQWENSRHSTGTASAAGRAGCADCHSAYGFVAKVDPMSNLTQKVGQASISCATCHDPHDAKNPSQLRTVAPVRLENNETITWGGSGKLCMNCHKSRRDAETYTKQYASHFGPHYSAQTDMLAGTNAVTFGRYLPSSTHRNALADACVSCHMFGTPGVGEPAQHEIGGHTWALTADGTDHVKACERCHGTMESFEDLMARADYDGNGKIESTKHELHGLLDVVGRLLPPLGDPSVVITAAYNPIQLKAGFNYMFVEEDGSDGMHNFQYAIGLLQVARDALTYGVLSAGKIEKIKDVPNDQGKQVSVTWQRFGGDGTSDNPVLSYYVWRRVDGDAAAKGGTVYTSFEEVPPQLQGTGAYLQLQDGLWTQVGTQAAAQMGKYNAVVPTLFDSTASGIRWSVFRVSGHTAIPQVYAISAPDSSYSVDNLAPAAPPALQAVAGRTAVDLEWLAPGDPDISYYAVHRSTTAGHAHTGDALANVKGTQYTDSSPDPGRTYYYCVIAYDHSGNRGAYSQEVEAAISTGIESLAGVPTEYELHQNYPNPFNPTTSITFAVPEAGPATISVYDMSGKEVAVLVDAYLSPGRYQVEWSAENRASGVYIYRLRTPTMVQSKSMLLLK